MISGCQTGAVQPPRHPLAGRGLGLLAAGFGLVLIAFGGRYGYHRDELYFVAIGGHPAFGSVDQPPLVPLLAHAVSAVTGGSLFWLRVPPALAGASVVLLTGLIAREFGATRSGQLFAAACMAVSAVLVATSHLASTSVYDLVTWTLLSWLVVRALRADGRSWLLVGLVAGLGLEIKTLPVFLLFALAVGVLAVGPRSVFASRWLWAGTGIALVLWLPNLWWQAAHGWPQLQLSSAIARGESGTSAPRAAFVPFQLVLISPLLVPVWIAGLVRLARDPELRTWRCFAVAYPVLVIVFLVTGGKPYYLCGAYPALLAAGAEAALRWARRGRAGAHAGVLVGVALGLSAAVSAVLFLPVVPVSALHSTPIVDINYDAGETVGWPAFARTVGGVYDGLPDSVRTHTVVLAENYGEAGAMFRYRPDVPTFGTHNSVWDLGRPPGDTTTAVVVGYSEDDLRGWFTEVRRVAVIDNGLDVGNDEQGGSVWLCTGPRRPWSQLWPTLRHLG